VNPSCSETYNNCQITTAVKKEQKVVKKSPKRNYFDEYQWQQQKIARKNLEEWWMKTFANTLMKNLWVRDRKKREREKDRETQR
jgi:hypothetical protein